MGNVQHNIEDKTFKALIRRYLKKRDMPFVRRLLEDYGKILEDRDAEAKELLQRLEAEAAQVAAEGS